MKLEKTKIENELIANDSAPKMEKQIDTEKTIGEAFYEDFRRLEKENPKGFIIAIKIGDGIKLDNVKGRYFVAFKNYLYYNFENKKTEDIILEEYMFVKLHSLFSVSFKKTFRDFAVKIWLNTAEGEWYADLGVSVDNLKIALAIAKKYEQKMVFDLKEQKEIFV